jgi:hypothetical protein
MNIGSARDPAYRRPDKFGRYYRRNGTRHSPLAFMLVYMTRQPGFEPLLPFLTPDGPVVSFSEFHLAMCEEAKHWRRPHGRRTGIIAPRGAGKSKLLYEALPLWALAHGHRKYFLGYADTDGQAVKMLNKLKKHLVKNKLLLFDYPELWTYRAGRNNKEVVDTQPNMDLMLAMGFNKEEAYQIQQSGGRVFMTAGIDKATLGASDEVGRPDLITIDDGEPTASGYAKRGGGDYKEERLKTIRDVILPMLPTSAVLLSGTVVMPGSIADDLVKAALGEPTEPWVTEERFNAAYFDAIQGEGTRYERSLWPEKWPLSELHAERIRNPALYATHMANRPITSGGKYWQADDFQYCVNGRPHFPIDHCLMYVDPAEESRKKEADYTGIVVIGVDGGYHRAVVLTAWQGQLNDLELGAMIAQYRLDYPNLPTIQVHVEGFHSRELRYNTLLPLVTRHGGVTLKMDRPNPMLAPTGETGKLARIVRALPYYRDRRVWHVRKFADLEALLTALPHVRRDDLPDALSGALRKAFGD